MLSPIPAAHPPRPLPTTGLPQPCCPCPDQSHHVDPHVEQNDTAQNQKDRVSEVLALPGVGARAHLSSVVGSLTHGRGSQDYLGPPRGPHILTRSQTPVLGEGGRDWVTMGQVLGHNEGGEEMEGLGRPALVPGSPHLSPQSPAGLETSTLPWGPHSSSVPSLPYLAPSNTHAVRPLGHSRGWEDLGLRALAFSLPSMGQWPWI